MVSEDKNKKKTTKKNKPTKVNKEEKFDNLYNKIKKSVLKLDSITTYQIQKDFSIGYKKAALILERLEDEGIVGPAVGKKPRIVLVNEKQEKEIKKEVVKKAKVKEKNSEKIVESNDAIKPKSSLSVKELSIMFTSIALIILAMILSNSIFVGNERQELMDQKTLPIRAKFSNESTNAPIQYNDVVTLSFSAYLDGEKVESISTNDNQIIIGKSSFNPSFDEQFINHQKGDRFDIIVKFAEDYPASDLAGRNVNFKVVIKDVLKLRDLDDSLVRELAVEGRKVGNEEIANLKTVADLENYIEKLIQMEKQIQEFNIQNRQLNE